MTEDRVDVAIKEVNAALEQPTTEVENAVTEEETPTEQPENEAQEGSDQAKTEKVKVPFPKEAMKAISRRDQKIGKLHGQYQAAMDELKALKEAQQAQPNQPKPQQNQDPDYPREEDYETYAELLEARIDYKINKNKAESAKQSQTQQQQVQHQQYIQERIQVLDTTEAELRQSAPDYDQVVDEYEDLITEASPELKELFLSADNPSLAFYNLAKMGKLESLLDMPIRQAAIEVGKALAMGVQQPKRVTQAPTPIRASTGTGVGKKSPEQMSYEELKAAIS